MGCVVHSRPGNDGWLGVECTGGLSPCQSERRGGGQSIAAIAGPARVGQRLSRAFVCGLPSSLSPLVSDLLLRTWNRPGEHVRTDSSVG